MNAADDWGRIWKCNDAGQPEYFAGRPYLGDREHEPADGQGDAAEFKLINAMAVDASDNLFVGDLSRIRKVTPAGLVTTVAGTNAHRGVVDGVGRDAQFVWIASIALDSRGSLVVAESGASGLRQVSPAGVVSTMEVTKAAGYLDGAWSEARFGAVWAPAPGADGNLYLTDGVQRVVRKVAPDGSVSLFAGTPGLRGSADGTLGAATFDSPGPIAVGPGGSLYLVDGQRLRRIANGIVSTIANLEGEGYAAGLAVDSDGNAAVSQPWDGVYLVTPSGTVSRVFDRESIQPLLGGPSVAPFFIPQGLAFDSAGNLYISDSGSIAIYKLDKDRKVTLFAGTPLVEGDQDGPPGTATFGYYGFDSMTIDAAGNLYLGGQGRMRKISPAGVVASPEMAWGNPNLYGLAWSKGKLYGMTAYAVLQLPVP